MKSHYITENPPCRADDVKHVLKRLVADDIEPHLVVAVSHSPHLPGEGEQSFEVAASSRQQLSLALEGPLTVPYDDGDLGGQSQVLEVVDDRVDAFVTFAHVL